MRLISVKVTAAPDSNPNEERTYIWTETAPLAHLEICIAKLTEFRDELRVKEIDPTKAQKPIET